MTINNGVDRELGWDDEISKESEFTIVPAGDYNFTVTGFERGRHNGSAKLPACNKATVSLELQTSTGPQTITDNLYLHTSTEGFLTAFFTGIGQKRKGEPVRMDWNKVVGSTGRLKLKIRNWKSNKTGEEMQSNEVQQYYEPTEQPAPQPTTYQAPPMPQQNYQQQAQPTYQPPQQPFPPAPGSVPNQVQPGQFTPGSF